MIYDGKEIKPEDFDEKALENFVNQVAGIKGKHYAEFYKIYKKTASSVQKEHAFAQMESDKRWFEDFMGSLVDVDEVLAAIRREVDKEG